MLGHFTGLLGSLIVGLLLALLVLLLLSLTAALRLLPRLASWAQRGLRCFMLISIRLYGAVLAAAAPYARQHWHIELLMPPWRILACISVSLAAGLLVLAGLRLPIAVWSLGLLILHGLLVGLEVDGRDRPESDDDLSMGVKMPWDR